MKQDLSAPHDKGNKRKNQNWYLPANAPAGEPLDVRHWYFPVTFPEEPYAPLATPADPAADPTAAASAAATPPRPVRLGSWREEHAEVTAAVAEGRPAAAADYLQLLREAM